MHEKKRIFYMYLQFISIIIYHLLTQHSDDLGDRKWLRTDFGMVWYTSIYVVVFWTLILSLHDGNKYSKVK